MSRYVTKSGDVLDAICKAEYGGEDRIAAVLDANPGLAALGPVFAAGITIDLPEITTPKAASQIRLWGGAPV